MPVFWCLSLCHMLKVNMDVLDVLPICCIHCSVYETRPIAHLNSSVGITRRTKKKKKNSICSCEKHLIGWEWFVYLIDNFCLFLLSPNALYCVPIPSRLFLLYCSRQFMKLILKSWRVFSHVISLRPAQKCHQIHA